MLSRPRRAETSRPLQDPAQRPTLHRRGSHHDRWSGESFIFAKPILPDVPTPTPSATLPHLQPFEPAVGHRWNRRRRPCGKRTHPVQRGLPAGSAAIVSGVQFITYGVAVMRRTPPSSELVFSRPRTSLADFAPGFTGGPEIIVTAAHCFADAFRERWRSSPQSAHPSIRSWAPHPTHRVRRVRHPGFSWSTMPLHDSAALVIDRPVCPARLARLPPRRLLSAMNAIGFLDGRRYDAVGYGVIEPADPANPVLDETTAGTRRVATGTHRFLFDSVLSISQDPTKGDGGTCGHDSGGPNLFAGTDLIAGQTQGGDSDCLLTNDTFRLDTVDAQDFLAGFVLIPTTAPICHSGGVTQYVTVEALAKHLQHGARSRGGRPLSMGARAAGVLQSLSSHGVRRRASTARCSLRPEAS